MFNISQFIQNPIQFLLKSKLNIPQDFNGNANDIIQYLLNTGQLTQEQFNRVNKEAQKLQNNPQFMKMFTNNK